MTTVDLQRRYSAQDLVRQDTQVGFGLTFALARAGELVPPWWSPSRDQQLRAFAKGSDHFSGAEWMIATKLVGVPYRVEPRDSSIKRHVALADEYQAILDNMVQFGQGWETFWARFLYDLWETDNGGFGEVIGEGDPNGPIQGPALGLAHLDSTRCTRTSNPLYPVLYQDTSGKIYRFHHTRVIFRSQHPSSAADMHGVGFSWLSRAINSVQRLVDIATYNQEKLGSRPQRGIITGKGIDADSIVQAVQAANETMDNRGLRRYAQFPILAHPSLTEWSIELLSLINLPDGFDERTTTEFAMFVIALAGGFPPRWLWPATAVGATKADAMYSHIAGTGGGATWHLNMMRDLLSYGGQVGEVGRFLPPKFLPRELALVFDYQDDEQDRLQAEIREKRAKVRETNLNSGVVNIRVSRERALSDGDLTQAQFDQLELEDGRLPNGDDVLTLFSSEDELIVELLDLGLDNPLLPSLNDAVGVLQTIDEAIISAQRRLNSSRTRTEREKIEQAMAALNKLRTLYEGAGKQKAPPQPVEEDLLDEDLEAVEEDMGDEPTPFELKAGGDDFGLAIRAAIRGLWAGETTQADFVFSMGAAIERRLKQAWAEGAAECGVKEDELTSEEISARETLINSQYAYLPGFAADVAAGSKANGGKLGPQLARSTLWTNRYNEAVNQAKSMACADRKLKWVLGPTEHCSTCQKLADKVKRGSQWDAAGIYPQMRALECKGYRCQCSLVPTDDPLSKGPLPSVP